MSGHDVRADRPHPPLAPRGASPLIYTERGAAIQRRPLPDPSKILVAQVRPCQGGIGSTGGMVATSAGKVTVGVRSRFCRQAEGIATFCPFSSKRIGPPIMA